MIFHSEAKKFIALFAFSLICFFALGLYSGFLHGRAYELRSTAAQAERNADHTHIEEGVYAVIDKSDGTQHVWKLADRPTEIKTKRGTLRLEDKSGNIILGPDRQHDL